MVADHDDYVKQQQDEEVSLRDVRIVTTSHMAFISVFSAWEKKRENVGFFPQIWDDKIAGTDD